MVVVFCNSLSQFQRFWAMYCIAAAFSFVTLFGAHCGVQVGIMSDGESIEESDCEKDLKNIG